MRNLFLSLNAIGLALLSTLEPSSAGDPMHRSLFYENTPFGSLAWVNGATTRSSARDMLTVDNVVDDACINLPASGVQWFMINHRDPELEDQLGYFLVRILYQTDPNATGGQVRHGLHVQRNGNWYDANKKLVRSHERQPDQITINEQNFIALHDPRQGDEANSLAKLLASLGPWHMAPSADEETSWADRGFLGASLRAYTSSTTSAISARLIRFTATSSTSSSDPVVFWLDPMGATSALILIDAPRHEYLGSRRVYDVKFGDACP